MEYLSRKIVVFYQQHLIHRDIKPANILIDNTGRAYLTDFGLAKETTGLERSLTLSGSVLGTPDHMSPEQARGEKRKIDQRSDIFSLGATLYHALTGHPPFRGKELYQVLEQVVNKDPVPPTRFVRNLPRDLETICLKCMEKDPASRYQSALSLAQDLTRFLKGEIILAKSTSITTKLWCKAMKNKLTTSAITAAAVILIAVILGLMVSSASKRKELELYRANIKTALSEKDPDKAKEFCAKLLTLSPDEKETKDILKRVEKEIEERGAEMRERGKRAEKVEAAAELRAKAKAILDRTLGSTNPDAKIKIAQEALEKDPTYGDAYQVIGFAYYDKGAYDKAYEALTKAIELTPTLAYSYYKRGYITAYQNDDLAGAIPDFEMVLKYDPNSNIGYYAKGITKHNQKDYDSAVRDYTRAIELDSQYADAYGNRGLAYYEKGDIEQAMVDYNKAIELDPKYANAYNNRGIVYKDKDDLERAMADFNKAIELNPKYASAYMYNNRGETYRRKGESARAIADFNKALQLNPNYTEAYNNRGNAYATKGNLEQAIADYNKAIELDLKNASAYNNRGIAYDKKGDLESAISNYNKAIKLNPKYAKAYNNRGNAYDKKGDIKRAIADYNKAIELDPRLTEAYYNRGVAYQNKGDLERAISDYNKAIELNPRYADAYNNRGIAYAGKKEFRKAIADGEMFLKLAPNHPAAGKMRDMIKEWKKQLK